MIQNARVTAFTTSELLKKTQHGSVKIPRTQIRVKVINIKYFPECISFETRIDEKSRKYICLLDSQVRPITDLNPS